MSITVVGSLNHDVLVRVAQLPAPGETVIGESVDTACGGKGANQAAAAAALGGRVSMVGRVGDDPAGAAQVRALQQLGVDTTAVRISADVPTGSATVVVDHESENLIVVAPGANATLGADDVRGAAVGEATILLLQLEIPLDTVLSAAATTTGRVVLNAAPVRPLPPELLERVDVLVVNEGEFAALAGHDGPADPSDAGELARRAREVARQVIVTLGARGALVVPADESWVLVEPPDVQAVDTTGAGDCFCGALCVTLDRGLGLVDSARYATAAAALSTTGAGARSSLPGAAQVAALLDRVR